MQGIDRWMKLFLIVGITIVMIVAPISAQEGARTPAEYCADAAPHLPETRTYEEAEWVLQEEINYRVIFCTDAGAIYIDLYEEITPLTVNNFLFLVERGYYDDTTFHRVLQDFMAQGGDPTATGRGGPGYQFPDEFVGFLTFDRAGLLAMANANNPDRGIFGTNGSQFFITLAETSWLNYRHTIFGEVLSGMDALRNLRLCDPSSCSEGDALASALIITDPGTVNAEIPTRAEPDPAAVSAGIENFFRERNFPDLEYGVGYFSAEDLRATARRADDAALLDYLAEYGLEYRIVANLETCAAAYAPLRAMRSALMSFPNEAAAQAALADDYWRLAEAEELQLLEPAGNLPGEVFSGEGSYCEDGQTRRAWMTYRYGANLMRVEASYALAEGEPDNATRWLTNSQFFFEPLLSEIIRAGLWKN